MSLELNQPQYTDDLQSVCQNQTGTFELATADGHYARIGLTGGQISWMEFPNHISGLQSKDNLTYAIRKTSNQVERQAGAGKSRS